MNFDVSDIPPLKIKYSLFFLFLKMKWAKSSFIYTISSTFDCVIKALPFSSFYERISFISFIICFIAPCFLYDLRKVSMLIRKVEVLIKAVKKTLYFIAFGLLRREMKRERVAEAKEGVNSLFFSSLRLISSKSLTVSLFPSFAKSLSSISSSKTPKSC